MKKYILFDLDGTLTDPKLGITTCVQYALQSFGIDEPNLDNLEKFIGPPLVDSFMDFYGFDREKAEAGVVKYRERFADVGLFENEIYPGVEHMLSKLSKIGFRLAVASSKPTVFVERILEHFHIRQYFKVVVGSELNGERSRKEEVIQETLRQLFPDGQIKYDEIYMVGDRCFDVDGAKAIHVESIGVTYGYGGIEELKEHKADYIVESVPELEHFILRELADLPKKQGQVLWGMVSPIIMFVLLRIIATQVVSVFFAWFAEVLPENLWNKMFFIDSTTGATMVNGTWGCVITMISFLVGGLVFYKNAWLQIETEYANTRLKQLKRKEKWVAPLGVLVTICFVIAGNAILTGSGLAKQSAGFQQTVSAQAATPFLLGMICYGLVTPIVEELLFRGVVFTKAKTLYSFEKSALFSTVLFAAYHMNPVQGIYAMLMGATICYFYDYFGSFSWPLFVHILSNVLVFVCGKMGIGNSKLFSLPVGIVLFIVGVAGLWFLQKERRIYRIDISEFE